MLGQIHETNSMAPIREELLARRLRLQDTRFPFFSPTPLRCNRSSPPIGPAPPNHGCSSCPQRTPKTLADQSPPSGPHGSQSLPDGAEVGPLCPLSESNELQVLVHALARRGAHGWVPSKRRDEKPKPSGNHSVAGVVVRDRRTGSRRSCADSRGASESARQSSCRAVAYLNRTAVQPGRMIAEESTRARNMAKQNAASCLSKFGEISKHKFGEISKTIDLALAFGPCV